LWRTSYEEMSCTPEAVRALTDCLNSAGNTTAAIGRVFAIASAPLVSLSSGGPVPVGRLLRLHQALRCVPGSRDHSGQAVVSLCGRPHHRQVLLLEWLGLHPLGVPNAPFITYPVLRRKKLNAEIANGRLVIMDSWACSSRSGVPAAWRGSQVRGSRQPAPRAAGAPRSCATGRHRPSAAMRRRPSMAAQIATERVAMGSAGSVGPFDRASRRRVTPRVCQVRGHDPIPTWVLTHWATGSIPLRYAFLEVFGTQGTAHFGGGCGPRRPGHGPRLLLLVLMCVIDDVQGVRPTMGA